MSAVRPFLFIPALLFVLVSSGTNAHAADPLEAFSKNKVMPDQYRKQILTALSYFPELENVHIVFRIAPQYTPFTTRPNLVGIFKRKNHRIYVITISNKTNSTTTLKLIDLSGRVVLQKQLQGSGTQRIDLPSIPKGMYFVSTINGKTANTQKLVVE